MHGRQLTVRLMSSEVTCDKHGDISSNTRVLTGAARQKLRRLVPTTITIVIVIIFIIWIAVFVVQMSLIQKQNQSDQNWSHRHTELSVPHVSLH